MAPIRRLLLFGIALMLAVLSAQAQIPRPEYPQPQWERGDWLSLNGTAVSL